MSYDTYHEQIPRFFLGADTPTGHLSRFTQIADPHDGWKLYLLYGGPGTGKSHVIRSVADALAGRCAKMEIIHCASDVESLDGVILHDIKCAVLDATPPHAIVPEYPGVCERIVNLGEYWDASKLEERSGEVFALSASIRDAHQRCGRYLGAAASLQSEIFRLALEQTDIEKIEGFAARLTERELPKKVNRKARDTIRFFSAVTNEGPVTFSSTAERLCHKIIAVDDDYGAASRLLLYRIRSIALASGFDTISCYCPLSPCDRLEHLFLPQVGLGFVTTGKSHRIDIVPDKIIHARRFTDNEALARKRHRISFARKLSAQIVQTAAEQLRDAKSTHDMLEQCYTPAMDFEKVGAKRDALIAELLDICDAAEKRRADRLVQ